MSRLSKATFNMPKHSQPYAYCTNKISYFLRSSPLLESPKNFNEDNKLVALQFLINKLSLEVQSQGRECWIDLSIFIPCI